MTMGITGWLVSINASAVRGTKDKQIHVREALISYLRANGRLPCPDVGLASVTAGPISAGVVLDGRENRSAVIGLNPDTTADCANVVGAIPYVDLGLPRDLALDAWGNSMLYRVSNNIPPTLPSSDWVRTSLSPATKASNRASMWVDDRVSARAAWPPVVAILISHGKNGAGAWTTRGTLIDLPSAGTDERVNADGCAAVAGGFICYGRDITESTAVTGGAFDDIVLGITTGDLTDPLFKDGSMKPATAALNEMFEAMIDDAATGATKIFNGVGAIPACSYTLHTPAPRLDPWGNSVTCAPSVSSYNIGAPGNLCSMNSYGPDRAAGGGDDISRTVFNSELDARLMRLGC